jgi:dihydropyrimidine dehydrogenase (NAD+) subunit PreT
MGDLKMGATSVVGDIAAGRISSDQAAENLGDLHPLYSDFQASAEADRCYFCYDAPCMQACPTSIDVPLFIRQISTGNVKGAATTILDQNIMGGMCARVCPTETLCEQVCVRNDKERKPVKIGRLQRYATDHLMKSGAEVFERAASTGKSVAVIGGGPAGLSCAHALASDGHDVTVFDAREKLGGLNEFGIASYKSVDNFAQREVDFILGIGGITTKLGQRLGEDFTLDELRQKFDAVFVGIGMGGVNALGLEAEGSSGVVDAVDYISDLRQSDDPSQLKIGRRVIVIGGGMTAVDIAVQSKLIGAEDVTIVYRRGKEQMPASGYEQELAQIKGVKIKEWAAPVRLNTEGGKLVSIDFARTSLNGSGKLDVSDDEFSIEADMVFKAIGQKVVEEPLIGGDHPLDLKGGRIVIDADRKTSLSDVWAGGDCVVGGEDLTVAAVEDGKVAAHAIHQYLEEGA